MFVDRVRIKVIAGGGGDGCCSFRREKYVPLGGPNGGDGGDGGDVFVVASDQLSSLLDIRYHAHWKGKRGQHGKGKDCHGRTGNEVQIPVPVGTIVRDFETRELLGDLTENEQRFCVGNGGKGGKGNARFFCSANRAPKFAELGEPGEDREYLLELKLIADVGIVGLPNAGKSTLLSHISAARPKIADYPFTTLSPNLGVVDLGQFRTLTIADIPGIIKGAAQGKGLGHDFLRHIERTRVLLFLIDLGDEDPLETRTTLEAELAEYSDVFLGKPRLYALNKADVTENREVFARLNDSFGEVSAISAVTGEGLSALMERLWDAVEMSKVAVEVETDIPAEREYTYAAPYHIEEMPGGFKVSGKRVVRVVRMTDFENEEAVRHLQYTLDQMGLFKALKRLGAQEGQTITIGEIEMDYASR